MYHIPFSMAFSFVSVISPAQQDSLIILKAPTSYWGPVHRNYLQQHRQGSPSRSPRHEPHMGVSINGGTQKKMVYSGKSH